MDDIKRVKREHLGCRTVGHMWDAHLPSNVSASWANVALTCQRCGTVRLDYVAQDGMVERRRYDYPESYRDSHHERTELRIELLRRLQRRSRS